MRDGYEIETQAVDMLAFAICHHVREEECELTMRQTAVLLTVRNKPDAVCSIAQSLKVSDAAASRAIDALQKHGLVRRARLPESRNRVTVSITPKGQALVGRLLQGVPDLAIMA
ncbi:MarR family transcriptional regulator [Sphingomonas sp. 3-13AW]|uniref:MarR family transcriptional regulator n=1 Tax=Sphingomonas sp. 3-13AW TaxID=3050450 RepID=UPI003BB699A0